MVRSSQAVETLALSDAFDYEVYLLQILSEFLYNNKYHIPIEICNWQ